MGDDPDTSITRPLLADGRIPCPVERTLVGLEDCYRCGYLVGAERDVASGVGEVVCDPPIGALVLH